MVVPISGCQQSVVYSLRGQALLAIPHLEHLTVKPRAFGAEEATYLAHLGRLLEVVERRCVKRHEICWGATRCPAHELAGGDATYQLTS